MTGIGGGLLQRCCFFGQHSHTLHSLLGLTDVKLKNELSALVDTSIWVNTLQDVKGREKKEKHRVTELSVEIRVREEEAARSKAAIDADKSALNTLENEVEEAKLKGDIDLFSFFCLLLRFYICFVLLSTYMYFILLHVSHSYSIRRCMIIIKTDIFISFHSYLCSSIFLRPHVVLLITPHLPLTSTNPFII